MTPDTNIPTVEYGTMVEVCSDGTFNPQATQFGFVLDPADGRHPRVVGISMPTQGAMNYHLYQTVVHVSDPTLEKRMDDIRNNDFAGVFRLTNTETLLRSLSRILKTLEVQNLRNEREAATISATLAEVTERLDKHEERFVKAGLSVGARRGRPPKQKPQPTSVTEPALTE